MAGVGQLTGTPGYGGGGRAPAAAQHGRYYTHQSQVPPGQKVGFTPGRGFYAAGAAPAAKAPVNPIVALVNQILAMQQKPLTQAETLRQQQADQQQQQLSNTTHGIIGALQAGIPAASQAYDSAIQQTSDLAKTASGLFQAANPDAQTQATLKAISAPAAQQQQVAGLDQSLFNGGPNYVLGGQIPGGLLAGQKAAQVGFLAGLPASYAAQGQIGQANLRNASDAAHASYLDSVQKILAQAPQLVQQYQSAADANKAKQEQLDLERQTLGLNTAKAQAGVAQGNARLKISQQNANTAVTRANNAQVNANRNYDVQLQRIGIQQAGLRLRAVQNQNKLKKGGYTAPQLAQLRAKAVAKVEDYYHGIAPKERYDTKTGTYVPVPGTGKPPVPYKQAIRQLVISGVPPSIAGEIVNSYYAPGEGGRPRTRGQKLKGSLGW